MRKRRVIFVLCAVLPVTLGCQRERGSAAVDRDTLPAAAPESTAVSPDTVMARDTAAITP